MPAVALAEHLFDLPDETATQTLAARFARAFLLASPAAAGLQVHLNGELGAGKTAFVRATLRALGHDGRVRSPTYTLVEPYWITRTDAAALSLPEPSELLIHHFDLYRFSDAAEWHEAGFDEYLASQAINLIEWPSLAADALGTPDLSLTIDIVGDGRLLTARAFTPRGLHCLHDVCR